MRQYNNSSLPPTHPQSLGNQRPQARPGSNTIGRIGEYSGPAAMQNSFDTADLSSASIESELKRIESYLHTDSTAYFKNMGITFSKPGKPKESGGFDTASFNTKDSSMNKEMFQTPKKMPPPLYEVNSENQNREMYESEGQPNSMAESDYSSAQDNAIIEQAIQRLNERSHPFYKELQTKLDNHQDYINNIIDQRDPRDQRDQRDQRNSIPLQSDDGDMEGVFGLERTSPIAKRNTSNSNKYPNRQNSPVFSASSAQTTADRTSTHPTKGDQYSGNYYDAEEGSEHPGPSQFKSRENPFRQGNNSEFGFALKIDQVQRQQQQQMQQMQLKMQQMQLQMQSIPTEPEVQDVDYFLKHLMIPRRMKISIDGVPFHEVIFVLALKFFEKSPYFENFVFEWLDVKSTGMIGYIKCDYIKYVYKQGQKRFNVACRDPRGNDNGEELLHYVHIEADTPEKCDLYVNGLNAVTKYMEKSTRNPLNMNKGM